MKRYTAQEMRDAILNLKAFREDKKTILRIEDMLLQAADDMERERKYEYSQRRHDEKLGVDVVDMLHCSNIEGATNLHGRFNTNGTIVRREVGEWEEVTDEE